MPFLFAGYRHTEEAHNTVCLHSCESTRLACDPFTLNNTIYFLTTYNESKEQKITKLLEEKGFTLKPNDFSLHPQYGSLGFSSFLLLESWTCVARSPELCPQEEAVTSRSIFWSSFKLSCCHNDIFL